MRSALLVLLGACAIDSGSPTETTADQDIVGGEYTVRWEAVGWVHGGGERCSGTLISPNVFLTAAHCTYVGPLSVGFGPYRTGQEYPVVDLVRSPWYQPGSEPNHDVAVLILGSGVAGIAPMPIAGTEYPGVVPPGRELRVIGYGDDTAGLTQFDPHPTAPRKTAHVHTDWVDYYSLGTTGINGAGCFGDSGGPIMDLNGTKVYGVSSQVYTPCEADTRNTYAAVGWEGWIAQAVMDHPPVPRAWSVPWWRYWNGIGVDHFFTYERNDGGYAYFGYNIEGSEGRVFLGAYPGTVPIYRYFNGSVTDHFYTTNWNELGYGAYGYNFERVEGYVFPTYYSGTVPLWRYWNGYGTDHFYTINRNDAGYAAYGYGIAGLIGYVYP